MNFSGLVTDLRRLGVRVGDVLLVHASLRSIGHWVCGGAPTVVRALLEVIGPDGTIIVPAQSPECQDPARWSHMTVAPQWLPELRRHLPPFDPRTTPATTMGAIAECVRTWPGARRSVHPLTSFAGIGPAAADLLAGHELSCLLGEESPLARLEAAAGRALLLGVGYERCTTFHLAEYRLPDPPLRVASCIVGPSQAERAWMDFKTVDLDSSDFAAIGRDLERHEPEWVRVDTVGGATARLLPIPEAVRFAHTWMLRNRPGGGRGTRQHGSSQPEPEPVHVTGIDTTLPGG